MTRAAVYSTERELTEILERARQDRKLRGQILRMLRLSVDLRERDFTGQIVLSFGTGLLADVEYVVKEKL